MGKLLGFFETVLGRTYDSNNLEDRVAIQKIVFLGQSMGLNIGDYHFVKKSRGPYSLALRLDVIDEIKTFEESSPPIGFSENAMAIIDRIRGLTDFQNDGDVTNNEKYELLASMYFLSQNDCRYSDKDAVLTALTTWKPEQYANEDGNRFDFNAAWSKVCLL